MSVLRGEIVDESQHMQIAHRLAAHGQGIANHRGQGILVPDVVNLIGGMHFSRMCPHLIGMPHRKIFGMENIEVGCAGHLILGRSQNDLLIPVGDYQRVLEQLEARIHQFLNRAALHKPLGQLRYMGRFAGGFVDSIGHQYKYVHYGTAIDDHHAASLEYCHICICGLLHHTDERRHLVHEVQLLELPVFADIGGILIQFGLSRNIPGRKHLKAGNALGRTDVIALQRHHGLQLPRKIL